MFTILFQARAWGVGRGKKLFYFLLVALFIFIPSETLSAQTPEPRVFLPLIVKPDPGAAPPVAGEWPQVQRDPQHTGFTPEILGTNFNVAWAHAFQPDKVYPQVQPIVYDSKVFVGTEGGKMVAFHAANGNIAWTFTAGGPILASAAAGDGKVYFAAMDGAVYAVNAASGAQVWKTSLSRKGFSTAPVLLTGMLLLGGRDGNFYALNTADGSVRWQYRVPAPVLQTAAWDGGRVYFGAMDMRVYALNTADGSLAWQSAKIPGMAFKDYWPVVYQGKVFVRAMAMGELGVPPGTNPADTGAQQAVLNGYDSNPSAYEVSLAVLDAATGQAAPMVIHYHGQTMNGATAPPCVDRDGYLVMPAPRAPREYLSGWGRLDVSRRMLVDLLEDTGPPPPDYTPGYGNPDENMSLTCTGNLILAMHTQEFNANFTGAFNLDTRRWTLIPAGHATQQMSTNTQGGGSNPASVAGGMVFHISLHNLIARTTQ